MSHFLCHRRLARIFSGRRDRQHACKSFQSISRHTALARLILSIKIGANRRLRILTMVRINVTSLVAFLIIAVTIQTVAGESPTSHMPIQAPHVSSADQTLLAWAYIPCYLRMCIGFHSFHNQLSWSFESSLHAALQVRQHLTGAALAREILVLLQTSQPACYLVAFCCGRAANSACN